MAGGHVLDAIRINWFLGIFALEMWGAAWYIAFEPEIRGWWQRRWMRRRWRHDDAPSRRARVQSMAETGNG
jgi:hypothetical protein